MPRTTWHEPLVGEAWAGARQGRLRQNPHFGPQGASGYRLFGKRRGMRLGLSPGAFGEAGGGGPEPHPSAFHPAGQKAPRGPTAPLSLPEKEYFHDS